MHQLYTNMNTLPFYSKDLSMLGCWYTRWVLEPIPLNTQRQLYIEPPICRAFFSIQRLATSSPIGISGQPWNIVIIPFDRRGNWEADMGLAQCHTEPASGSHHLSTPKSSERCKDARGPRKVFLFCPSHHPWFLHIFLLPAENRNITEWKASIPLQSWLRGGWGRRRLLIQDILSRDCGLFDFGCDLREGNLTDGHHDQVCSMSRSTSHADPKGLFVLLFQHHKLKQPLLKVCNSLRQVVKLYLCHEAGDGQSHDSTCQDVP